MLFSLSSQSIVVSDFWIRSGIREDHTASYFSHNNEEATQLREKLSEDSLDMLIQWLKDGGNVGIHGNWLSLLASLALTDAFA